MNKCAHGARSCENNMSRFNNYFTSGFSGCKLVATGYDPHRERDVRMFLIPGHIDVLGVTDTVDSWIAPLSSL